MRLLLFSCLLFLSAPKLFSKEDVKVNLYSPVYEDGVLKTTQGGVLEGEGIRIQAKNITYTRKVEKTHIEWHVTACGDLLVHFYDRHFVGEQIEYDFQEKKGVIVEGRTQIGNWYLGGEKIRLHPDGTYRITNMDLTTCPGENSLWKLRVGKGSVQDYDLLTASNVKVKIWKIPVFWFPYFKAKISTLKDLVAKYEFITGGDVGQRMSMRYQIYSWKALKAFLQADYWYTRGPSASLQFDYEESGNPTTFKANNFIAFDYHGAHPYGTFRNRFVGEFKSKLFDRLNIEGSYDKLSDDNVLATYFNRGYFLHVERRTKLEMQMADEAWLAFLRTEMRINRFDIVSQELPLFKFHLRPITSTRNPLIADLFFNAGYLDYVYGNVIPNSPENFRSGRVELRPRVYLPLRLGPLTVTPQAEYVGIGYTQSLQGKPLWNSLARLEGYAFLSASKLYGPKWKHVLEPYTQYIFISRPTVSFEDHYLFNTQDAYVKLNQLKWGLKSFLYNKPDDKIYLPLYLDVFSYGFFNNSTIGSFIPKMYVELSSRLPNIYAQLIGGYNFQHDLIDFANARLAYTYSENFAFSLNYMHRSRYQYTKADESSFLLDVFRSQADLLASPLSNRRDAFQGKVYMRPIKNLIFEFETRVGWRQVVDPAYHELFFHVTILLPCNWKFRFTTRYTVEEGWRFPFVFSLGDQFSPLAPPPRKAEKPYIYW